MTFGDGHGIYQHIGNIAQSDADKLVKAVPTKPHSDNLSKISASTARMLSLPPRSIAAWGRAGTMSAHRAPYHGRVEATVLHVFRASPKCNNKALAERSRFGRSGYLAGEARTKPRGGTDNGTGAATRDLRQTSSASPFGASNFA
jgi:hypothetical protein